MDIGPIPKSKIDDYATRHELGSLFVWQMMELDRRYLDGNADKLKRAAS